MRRRQVVASLEGQSVRDPLGESDLHGLIVGVAEWSTHGEERAPGRCYGREGLDRHPSKPRPVVEAGLGHRCPRLVGLRHGSVIGEAGLIGTKIAALQMVAVVLDDVHVQHEVLGQFALNTDSPFLNVAEFKRTRINADHAPPGEVGVLADVDRRSLIATVPVKRCQNLIVEEVARIEAIRNASPGIQVERHVADAIGTADHGLRSELIRRSEVRSKVVEVLFALKRVAAVPGEFQCAGLPGDRVEQSGAEIGPATVLLVIAAVEIPAQIEVQGQLACDLDVVLSVEREGFAPAVGVVGLTDRGLVHLAEQETGKAKSGGTTVGAGGLSRIKRNRWNAIVSVTVELHEAHFRAEFPGVAAFHPGQVVADDARVTSVEIVELAAQRAFVDLDPTLAGIGGIGRAAVLVGVNALEPDNGEVPRPEVSEAEGGRPVALLRYGGTGVSKAVEGDVEYVQETVGDGP